MAKSTTRKKSKKVPQVPIRLQLLIVTSAVLLLFVFGLFVAWLDSRVDGKIFYSRGDGSSIAFGDVTVKGESTCLQRKDADSGPQTTECGIGIKTPSGDYAVIGDAKQLGSNNLEATGTLSLPPDDGPYDIQGIITAK